MLMVEKSNKIYISRFIRISIYILRNLNLYNAVECFDCLDKQNGRSSEAKYNISGTGMKSIDKMVIKFLLDICMVDI